MDWQNIVDPERLFVMEQSDAGLYWHLYLDVLGHFQMVYMCI